MRPHVNIQVQPGSSGRAYRTGNEYCFMYIVRAVAQPCMLTVSELHMNWDWPYLSPESE